MSASLLDRESTGGAVARVGFEYQDAFVLQHLPMWLAQGAFSHVVSEALCDVEVCYFGGLGRIIRVLHEAKDYALTSTQFWDEMQRFQAVHQALPLEALRFVLVCRDYKSVTAPLVAKLERLRGVGTSYEKDSPILVAGRAEVVQWVVEKHEQSAELAEFVFDRVFFLTFAAESADHAFHGVAESSLPSLDMRAKETATLRDKFKGLVARSAFRTVHRIDLEAAVTDVLGLDDASMWLATSTRVHLCAEAVPENELGLVVRRFNDRSRGSLPSADWMDLAAAASGIGQFIQESRVRTAIVLDGKLRMSLACLLGHVFAATKGFVLAVEHNGATYRTDEHSIVEGTFFQVHAVPGSVASTEGIVCIGFPTPVGPDVELAGGVALNGLQVLALSSDRAVDGIATLNLAVAEAKTALVRFRSEQRLSRIHLFLKAPSAFSMVLGHRLNGVGEVQLYDWVDGSYLPTALCTPT